MDKSPLYGSAAALAKATDGWKLLVLVWTDCSCWGRGNVRGSGTRRARMPSYSVLECHGMQVQSYHHSHTQSHHHHALQYCTTSSTWPLPDTAFPCRSQAQAILLTSFPTYSSRWPRSTARGDSRLLARQRRIRAGYISWHCLDARNVYPGTGPRYGRVCQCYK